MYRNHIYIYIYTIDFYTKTYICVPNIGNRLQASIYKISAGCAHDVKCRQQLKDKDVNFS